MVQFDFEFWQVGNPAAQRISVYARTYENARQTVIGRYAPCHIRRMLSI